MKKLQQVASYAKSSSFSTSVKQGVKGKEDLVLRARNGEKVSKIPVCSSIEAF